jgi:hypothetical protein
MKKSTFILIALVTFAVVSCASGHRPQRPRPLPKGRRHGGSIAMVPVQLPIVQHIG